MDRLRDIRMDIQMGNTKTVSDIRMAIHMGNTKTVSLPPSTPHPTPPQHTQTQFEGGGGIISSSSFKVLAQIVFEISCSQDFIMSHKLTMYV